MLTFYSVNFQIMALAFGYCCNDFSFNWLKSGLNNEQMANALVNIAKSFSKFWYINQNFVTVNVTVNQKKRFSFLIKTSNRFELWIHTPRIYNHRQPKISLYNIFIATNNIRKKRMMNHRWIMPVRAANLLVLRFLSEDTNGVVYMYAV